MVLSTFSLIYISAVVCLIFLSFLYLKKDTLFNVKQTSKSTIMMFIVLITLSVLLRMLLFAAIRGYDSDMGCWLGWGNQLLSDGLKDFYTATGHEWYDYPPGYMYVLLCITFIAKITHINETSFFSTFIYILPAIIADVLSAILIYYYGGKLKIKPAQRFTLAVFILFNPAVFFLSGAWGQIDSLFTLLLILTLIFMINKKYWAMGILYGLAIATKWQALILGPVLVLGLIMSHNFKDRKENLNIIKIVASGILSLAVVILLSLPFKADQGLFWIIDKLTQSTGGYNYATIEAYNFFGMLGANWRWADDPFIFGISYKVFGSIMIILSVIVTAIMFYLDRLKLKDNYDVLRRRIFLHAAFFMFSVYTFGHYMHERYIFPVVILLLFSYLVENKKDILFSNVLLSSAVFLNEMIALYVAKPEVIDTIRMGSAHKTASIICGVLEVCSFVFFVYAYARRNSNTNS